MTDRISPLATRSRHDRVLPLDLDLVRRKARDARLNARKREIHVLHDGDPDPLQRMLNALQPGSYVPPHRHLTEPKAEALVLLQGAVAFVPFMQDGSPDTEHMVHVAQESGVVGVDWRAGVWHTFFALEPDSVVFEVKTGPYDASTDKEFAPWAPREEESGAGQYLAQLEDEFRRRFGLERRNWSPDA
jgi:cupin fold WbuC family metalloprotein